ncbi:hypothetical protein DJ568_12870 [Mucilaginibacter hurinus]|uniref:Uncharacterized protein n=1 Tax=Mucilaginibacter hurinus TaxID=2201324 RepID=A0A367GLP5_9SPHI|nr:hypothetical protein [Mucilaginibacter hurinus]RCH54389.1 hypothetical protein DJ568_12870 [Mucilaginibacter hurinus]
MNDLQKYPGSDDESVDNDNDFLNEEQDIVPDKEDLKYSEEDDSFELDVESEDPDYDHPDPYNTSVKNGADFDSSYDEANPYAVDEYIPNENLETDVDQLAMHIDSGQIVEVDPADELISRTPEDDRDDLDEEGYPKNDLA